LSDQRRAVFAGRGAQGATMNTQILSYGIDRDRILTSVFIEAEAANWGRPYDEVAEFYRHEGYHIMEGK
jgi:hypothetical protein